ncbi:MAG: hypothetical protein WA485_22300 [Candidatus Sulfotelmatobacter sp.]
MKLKPSRTGSSQMQANEIVRAEMQTFVLALVSYPERFAANPRVSFDQHRISLMVSELVLRRNMKTEN